MPFKNFTPSELLASDVNTYLMNQTVMTFDSAAARSTALTLPVEGMVTFLKDSDTLWIYNGTAWIELARSARSGLVLIKEQALSGTATNVTSCFSSTYTNYLIVGDSLSFSGTLDLYFRLLVGTTEQTGTNYCWAFSGFSTGAATFTSSSVNQNWCYTGATNNGLNNQPFSQLFMNFSNPNVSARTVANVSVSSYSAAFYHYNGIVVYDNLTVCDGIRFISSNANTLGGTIRVYGYNK